MVWASFPLRAATQLDGGFTLSKAAYLTGEPVFLSFTVKNVSMRPILIRTASPLSFCSGYQFELKGARDREATGCRQTGAGGSCASSDAVLTPGKSHTDRILLNARYDLRQSGSYSLHVTYRLNYGPEDGDPSAHLLNKHFQEFQYQSTIMIEPSQTADLEPEFVQYEQALGSADMQTKLEAAEVIAYLAPEAEEATILKMLDVPLLQSYGVEGLRNLGTPSAHRALAKFVKDSPPTNVVGVYQDALRSLGEIGDGGDVSVLLDAAHANAADSISRMLAIESAGSAGGSAAVPALVAELKGSSVDTRQAAVRALYLTGSREAVPVLIDLLRSPEWRVSLTAEYGLEVLTHRSGSKTNSMNPPPPDAYTKWNQWWRASGSTATIFKSDQCGEVVPLPSL
jgi:hypothetical protein